MARCHLTEGAAGGRVDGVAQPSALAERLDVLCPAEAHRHAGGQLARQLIPACAGALPAKPKKGHPILAVVSKISANARLSLHENQARASAELAEATRALAELGDGASVRLAKLLLAVVVAVRKHVADSPADVVEEE